MANPFDDLIPQGASPFSELIPENKDGYPSSMSFGLSESEPLKYPFVREALKTEGSLVAPFARLSKYLAPTAGKAAKYLADYAGTIGQSAGLGAALDATSDRGRADEGAISGAASASVIHPIASLAASRSPLTRIGGMTGLGALAAYGIGNAVGHPSVYGDTAGGLLGLAAAMRGRSASKLAANDLLGNINQNEAISNKKSAERLGLSFITPGEATGSPISLKAEREAGSNKEAAQELFEKKSSRQKDVKKSLADLFESISPKNAYEEIEKPLYEKSYNDSVPMENIRPLFRDARIKNSFKAVALDKDFSNDLKEVEPNSIKYLDYVKKHLDDEIGKAEMKGEKNRVRLMQDSKKKLLETMDSSSESYPQARAVSSKRQTRDALENSMNESEISGKSFYDANLSNDYGFKKLLRSLSGNHESQQKLKDMRAVFKNILEPLNARSVASLAQSSEKDDLFSKPGILKKLNKQLLGGEYDKAIVKLMTSNSWDKDLKDIAKMKSSNDKAAWISNLLSRLGVAGSNDLIQYNTQ